MRARIAVLSLSVFLGAAVSSAQNAAPVGAPQQVDYSTVNCAGFVSDQKVPDEMRIISSEQSNFKITFARGDYVHINRGLDKGVRVGDRFSVVRPDKDPTDVPWFKWQSKLFKAMGQLYMDAGQLRVVSVQPKVSVARVSFSCDFMQRGDIVLPYQDRPAPVFKDPAAFDHFAPISGKLTPVYVNLGTNQGVKVGDYFRIFRYQGSNNETVELDKGYQYKLYGFGSAPQRYEWNDLPREVLGEGIVLSVSRNSSTIMITFTNIEVYAGDYVEIE